MRQILDTLIVLVVSIEAMENNILAKATKRSLDPGPSSSTHRSLAEAIHSMHSSELQWCHLSFVLEQEAATPWNSLLRILSVMGWVHVHSTKFCSIGVIEIGSPPGRKDS